MKKTILAFAAAGLLPLAGAAATNEPGANPAQAQAATPAPANPSPPAASTPPAPGKTTPAPARFEPKTTYGDIARVLSSQPVYERTPSPRRECRMENTGYNSAATEVPRCDDPSAGGERIVAYDVTYQYMGRDFRIRLPYQPGEQIAVNVEVRPPLPDRVRGTRPSLYRGPY
jgi:uncharacterized protein YcfJ